MQASLRDVHATLIEQQAQPPSLRDPLVSLEDLTPPVASHSPVTISTARALGTSGELDGSLAPARSEHRGGRWLAIGGALVLTNALAWIGWQHQQVTMRMRASEITRSTTPAVSGDILSAAAPAPPRESVDGANEPTEARRTERSETKRPGASHRTENDARTHRNTSSPGTRPAKAETSTPSEQHTAIPTVTAEARPEAVDPLDRRR